MNKNNSHFFAISWLLVTKVPVSRELFVFFFIFLQKKKKKKKKNNVCYGYSLDVPHSTHNICFHEEIRKLHVSTFLVKTCINYAPDFGIQSTLIILTSKGLSEILRDIHTSTYQNCRIEKK